MRWTGSFLLFLVLICAASASAQEAKLEQIKVEAKTVSIFFTAASGVTTKSFTLSSPARIVVDLQGVRCSEPRQLSGQGNITKVRASQYAPGITRVVLDLGNQSPYQLTKDEINGQLAVKVQLGSTVNEIQLESSGPLPTLSVHTEGEVKASVFTLRWPERLVLDIENASLGKITLPRGIGPVIRVRASQFNEQTVRVVLDLTMPFGGLVETHPGKIQLQMRYKPEKISWQGDRLVVKTQGPLPQTPVRAGGIDWLEFPLTDGADVKFPKLPSGIALSGKQEEKSWYLGVECPGKKMRLISGTDEIALEFLPSVFVGVTVVVDPGHGGADPGAIGPAGIREKDITLAIAKQTVNFLKASGADVHITRSDDYYVSLASRVAQSHSSGAQIFVSIHCNSFGDNSTQGVETFYAANSSDGKLLAKAIQSKVLALRPSLDRGVKVGNLYVIRENAATSVLVEVAFISNPQEEALLAEPDYQQKVGRAITDGIEAFLEESQK
jgi:N-acetylmuramoyl-L-alanine amidase